MPDQKTDSVSDYVLEHDFDVFITETWLNQHGHECKCKQLTPPGYRLRSFPRLSRGGGIAVIYKDILHPLLSFRQSSPFATRSFGSVEFLLKQPGQSISFTCLCTPSPSRQNKLTASLFRELSAHLDHYSLSPSKPLLLGDFSFYFDS